MTVAGSEFERMGMFRRAELRSLRTSSTARHGLSAGWVPGAEAPRLFRRSRKTFADHIPGVTPPEALENATW